MTDVREEVYSEDELDILHEIHAMSKQRGPSASALEQIKQRIPRVSHNAARRAIWDLNNLGYVEMPRYETKRRKCMSCEKIFDSAGPQNRLCARCRTTSTACIEI